MRAWITTGSLDTMHEGEQFKPTHPLEEIKPPIYCNPWLGFVGYLSMPGIVSKLLQRLMKWKWPDEAKFWKALNAEQKSLDLKP